MIVFKPFVFNAFYEAVFVWTMLAVAGSTAVDTLVQVSMFGDVGHYEYKSPEVVQRFLSEIEFGAQYMHILGHIDHWWSKHVSCGQFVIYIDLKVATFSVCPQH